MVLKLFLLIYFSPYLWTFPPILTLCIGCLVSAWLQPLWLREAETEALFYCQEWIIPFISHEGQYENEGQLLSPFSPHYHCSLSVCFFPAPLPSLIFLSLLLQKCSLCTCTSWGMPARAGGFHCAESEKYNSNWDFTNIKLKWLQCSRTVCQLTSCQDKIHIYICPNGSQIILEISYLEAADTALLYSTVNFRTWWEFTFIAILHKEWLTSSSYFNREFQYSIVEADLSMQIRLHLSSSKYFKQIFLMQLYIGVTGV